MYCLVSKCPAQSITRPRSSGKSEPSPRRPGAPLLMAALQTTLWRCISGILGVTCLSLMAVLGTLLVFHTSHKNNNEQTISPGDTAELQEDSGNSSCRERWIGYKCNCYFISSELKTWKNSNDSCAAQNSTLLQMDNRDELACI
ncbi:natural killer cells antigen CD94-like [Talpa occidentalis]|uniref:natural killer cells antigen CD94-like n=1 Tax=Talpa occidentalis TaxID=50954 RepID=UPI0023F8CD1C|nr:natural killer cells antigen CD94-like [Talpa occidentalis]